jgi:hypothetical protein
MKACIMKAVVVPTPVCYQAQTFFVDVGDFVEPEIIIRIYLSSAGHRGRSTAIYGTIPREPTLEVTGRLVGRGDAGFGPSFFPDELLFLPS